MIPKLEKYLYNYYTCDSVVMLEEPQCRVGRGKVGSEGGEAGRGEEHLGGAWRRKLFVNKFFFLNNF